MEVSPELLDQFQANLAQNIHMQRGFKPLLIQKGENDLMPLPVP